MNIDYQKLRHGNSTDVIEILSKADQSRSLDVDIVAATIMNLFNKIDALESELKTLKHYTLTL